MIALAVALAGVAACLFGLGAWRQHHGVRQASPGSRADAAAVRRLLRSRTWLSGSMLVVTAAGLHIVALGLAPVAVVQPVGVLSVVVMVVVGQRNGTVRWTPAVRAGVTAVCLGTAGFVTIAAWRAATAAGGPPSRDVAVIAVGTAAIGLLGWRLRGRVSCPVLATAAAGLFGIGAVLVKATIAGILGATPLLHALAFAAAAAGVLAAGGWLLQQAHTSGPAPVVVAVTTVADPVTAVLVSGAALPGGPVLAVALGAAGVGVAGVVLLSCVVPDLRGPDPQPIQETGEPSLPAPRPVGMTILIAADTFPPDINGAAHFAERLTHGLARRGHDVHVVCPSLDAKSQRTAAEGVTVHRVPSRGTPFHPTFRICTPRQAARAAASVIAELRPDVAHVQSHFGIGRSVVSAAGDAAVPVIATNHFMPDNLLGYVPLPRSLHPRLSRWGWRDAIRVLERADEVTAPTPRAVLLLHEQGLTGPATAVSCGIDLEHYAAPDRSVRPKDGPVTVLFTGRLDAEKHVDQLLRAVALLPSRVGLRVEIVGDGVCAPQLRRLATQLGISDRVQFHGFVSDSDLVRAYRRADIFCMPGTAELQSLATMEAMAAGLPVLAADAVALPHLVRHGANGYLFDPGEVSTLAQHLLVLAADAPRRWSMGRASLQLIRVHGYEQTLDSFEALYRASFLGRMPESAVG